MYNKPKIMVMHLMGLTTALFSKACLEIGLELKLFVYKTTVYKLPECTPRGVGNKFSPPKNRENISPFQRKMP